MNSHFVVNAAIVVDYDSPLKDFDKKINGRSGSLLKTIHSSDSLDRSLVSGMSFQLSGVTKLVPLETTK